MSYSKVNFGDKKILWSGGAGKGSDECPVNRAVFRQNHDAIKKGPMRGTAVAVKAGKTTYKY